MPNLSLPAAAVVWGVSRRTAYRLAKQGLVRVARFGRRVTIPAEEVDRVRLEGVSAAQGLTPAAPLPLPRSRAPKAREGHAPGVKRRRTGFAGRTRLRAGLPPFETAAERGPGFTVLEVLDFYAARPEGAASNRGAQHRSAFAATALASRPAEAFALEDLEGFVVARRSVAKRKASAATCAKDFRYLKAACAYAKAKGKITRHYFENLAGDRTTRSRLMPAYKVRDSIGKVIPQEHLEAIFRHLHRDARRAVLFARTTGCRKGEVSSLDWEAHWSPEGFRPITQKGSSPRVVPCDSIVVGGRGIGLVFSELGGTEAAIYARLTACWRYAVKAAKVGAYRFHDLRHSHGTDLRASGRSFDDVAAIMGISAAMAHVYAHEDTEALQREAIQAGTNPAILALA